MRKKKKIKSEIEKKYYKERKLVLQRISRAKKRGFIVPEKLLPAIPKKITAGSIRRLEKLSAKYIQKKSEFKGKKGVEARQEYQKEFVAKRKSSRKTNKIKKIIQKILEFNSRLNESDLFNLSEIDLMRLYEEEKEKKESAWEEEQYYDYDDGYESGYESGYDDGYNAGRQVEIELPKESELVYQEIVRILEAGANKNYCFVAMNYLNNAIGSRGFQEVMQSINESPDELKNDSNVIAFASDQEQIQMALSEFITLISGRALDSSESMKVAEEIEEQYFNQKFELNYFE